MNRNLFRWLFICMSLLAVSLSATAQSKTESTKDSLGVQLGEASVKATRLLFVTKKDTVVFDLDALVTERGVSLGDALRKLPGMEVREGVLYFNGKAVERLMVNGIDFSRENPHLALSNLPVYIVKNVKAYERKSDAAMITGIDDGVRNQVVDVILRKEYNGTWTGSGTAAGGTKNTFALRGYANTFTDRFRITLFGNANNLNQQLWYGGDGSEQRQYASGARNSYRAPGASFFWKTDKQEGKRGYFIFEFSGDYNHNNLRNNDRSEIENYLEGGNTYNSTLNFGRGKETRWAMHPSFKWNPTDWTFLQYSSNINLSETLSRRRNSSATWSENPFAYGVNALDSLLLHPEGWPNAQSVTTLTRSEAKDDRQSAQYNHTLYFTQRLSEDNWRFVLRNQAYRNTGDARSFSLADYRYYQSTEKPQELLNRYATSDSRRSGQMTFLDLNIPVAKRGNIRTTYGYTTSRNKGQDEGYLLNLLGRPYDDFATAMPLLGLLPDAQTQWQAAAREAETTRSTESTERKHWAELYGQYSHNGWYFHTQATLRFAHEILDYDKMGYDPLRYRRHFRDGNISSLLKYENDSIGRFELRYEYAHSAPQYLSMVTIPDYSDPLNVALGNPNLKHRQSHDLTFNYSKTNANTKGRLFSYLRLSAWYNFLNNDVTYAKVYNRTTGVTTTKPVNVNGNHTVYFRAKMGLPWKKTITGDLSFFYMNIRDKGLEMVSDFSQLNFLTTNRHTVTWGGSVTYTKGGFSLRLPFYHSFVHYVSDYASVDGQTKHSFRFSPYLTWKLPARFEISSVATMVFSRGYGADLMRRNKTDLWVRLNKTLLKGDRLTLYLEGKDLLNQDDGYQGMNRMDAHAYRYTETLGRYVMLGLTYRFSTKK